MSDPPLAGVRVLDMASLYAAPMVATLLADHGADVVKVEPPAGDRYRAWPAMWAIVGRGKRSLTLDLTQPEGCALVHRLLPNFDVVVENLPRRLSEARGLTPEELRATHPRLVVVSASGFGHDGPYAGRPANGTLGEALSGLTHLTGEAEGAPMLPSVPLGDAVAAAYGAFGALVGVVGQLRSGEGAQIDLTVFEPMLHALGPALPAQRAGQPSAVRDGGAMWLDARGTFRSSDGRWLAMSCTTPRQEQSVAEVVGGGSGPLRERIGSWIAARTREDALSGLTAARVPVMPVNDLADVLLDAQVAARGSVQWLGEAPIATPAPRIVGVDQREPSLPPLGDANERLLQAELGLSAAEVDALRRRGIVA